ncbi:MAG: formate dehydrogenase accessory sulfurtransferase FdhD [Desulfomonile tiedjei]|nr:formate dehydrogenase accessory sulfurtransferase FdhD [Desulfomonile tiedjei]
MLVQFPKDPTHPLTTEFAAQRYNKGVLESATISLAKEVPFTLFVNDNEILSISTLPTHLKELFVGFLVSEGVILSREELLECSVDYDNKLALVELNVPTERVEKLEQKGMLTSGCAGGLVFSLEAASVPSGPKVALPALPCSVILQRMRELDTFPGLYSVTRGVHAASVADWTRNLAILEDIGRHNAVDKIVGHCFLNQIETNNKLLLTTGRITSEVLVKAARSRFPIIVSRSSASALAISMAKQSGIDVVTYVRAGRFNYFSHGGVELVQD